MITVPFPFESPASGIGDTGYHPVVWYRRTFTASASPGRVRIVTTSTGRGRRRPAAVGAGPVAVRPGASLGEAAGMVQPDAANTGGPPGVD